MRDFEAMIQQAVRNAVRQELERVVQVEIPAAIRRALYPRWVSARTLAHLLDLSERQIRGLQRSGKLPHVRVNGSVRFDLQEIERAVTEGYVPAVWRYKESAGDGAPGAF